MVKADGTLDKRLKDVTKLVLLKDTVSEDAVIAKETLPSDTEGTIVEDIIT